MSNKFKVYRPDKPQLGLVVVEPMEECGIDGLAAYRSEEDGVVSYHINFKNVNGFVVVARDDKGYWSKLSELFNAETVDLIARMYVLAVSEVSQ